MVKYLTLNIARFFALRPTGLVVQWRIILRLKRLLLDMMLVKRTPALSAASRAFKLFDVGKISEAVRVDFERF